MTCMKTTWQPCQNPYYFSFRYLLPLQQRNWMQNAPVVNNVIGNWKLLGKKINLAFLARFSHDAHQVLSSVGDRVFSSAWGDTVLSGLQQNTDSALKVNFFFPLGHFNHACVHFIIKCKKKSSQFYLISWKGKAFSRSLIKCSNPEGGCLLSRPILPTESSRERKKRKKKK